MVITCASVRMLFVDRYGTACMLVGLPALHLGFGCNTWLMTVETRNPVGFVRVRRKRKA